MEKGKENVRLTSGKRKYNIIPKIMCLAAAFVLWLYVMQIDSVDTESTFTGVRVYLENTSEIESRNGLFVYSGDGTLVNVTVTGRKSVINSYTSDDIRVEADLSGVTAAGIYDIKLSARLPNGLTLSGMSADTIPVYVDERDKKTLEVKAKLVSGTVAEGYELGELSPKYDNITVTGPKVALNDIDYAQIKLALGSIESSVTSVGQIELVSTSGESIDARCLQLSRTEMEVKVPLYTYKEVSLTAVSKYGYLTKENSVITVSPPKVTLKGDPTVLASIDSLTVATVDEKQLLGDSTLTVDIVPPDGVTVADGTERAAVKIEHSGTVTKTYTVDTDKENFVVVGAEGIKYEIRTKSVNVTLRGALDDLLEIDSSDITATLDLSEAAAGVTGTITQILKISVDVEGVYEIGEYTVQVNIDR